MALSLVEGPEHRGVSVKDSDVGRTSGSVWFVGGAHGEEGAPQVLAIP